MTVFYWIILLFMPQPYGNPSNNTFSPQNGLFFPTCIPTVFFPSQTFYMSTARAHRNRGKVLLVPSRILQCTRQLDTTLCLGQFRAFVFDSNFFFPNTNVWLYTRGLRNSCICQIPKGRVTHGTAATFQMCTPQHRRLLIFLDVDGTALSHRTIHPGPTECSMWRFRIHRLRSFPDPRRQCQCVSRLVS